MSLIYKSLDSVTEADIQALVTGGVSEGRRIEYKRDLPGNSDEDKREFLADVSSFANASGGDILYGVVEEGGIPTAIPGVQISDPDAEVLRLESLIRTGVAPRLPGVHLRTVSIENGGYVLVVRLPQSWNLPHMVIFKNVSRFYSRTSAGKYQLDVSELRALFAHSGETADRVRRFRDERLARIVAGEGAFELNGSAMIVMHLVPFGFFDPSARLDIRELKSKNLSLAPLFMSGWSNRYNLDGYVTFQAESGLANSYVQLFRQGAIEAVDAWILSPPFQAGPAIPGQSFVDELLKTIPKYLEVQRDLGVEPPIVILLTILGVKGYRLATGQHWRHSGQAIDRNIVQAPEVIMDDWSTDVARVLRPALDAIWNAAGWSHCSHYDDAGNLNR